MRIRRSITGTRISPLDRSAYLQAHELVWLRHSLGLYEIEQTRVAQTWKPNQACANELKRKAVMPSRGKNWYASSVKAVLDSRMQSEEA
jgi:hypothetical protein